MKKKTTRNNTCTNNTVGTSTCTHTHIVVLTHPVYSQYRIHKSAIHYTYSISLFFLLPIGSHSEMYIGQCRSTVHITSLSDGFRKDNFTIGPRKVISLSHQKNTKWHLGCISDILITYCQPLHAKLTKITLGLSICSYYAQAIFQLSLALQQEGYNSLVFS